MIVICLRWIQIFFKNNFYVYFAENGHKINQALDVEF